MQTRPPESVQVFTSGQPQGRQFVDIAYLEAEQESDLSSDNTPEFLTRLRTTAARMGCDGLVVGNKTNAVVAGLVQETAGLRGIVATCIMFTDDSSSLAVTATPSEPAAKLERAPTGEAAP